MSIVKIGFSSSNKLKSRKIRSACRLSLTFDGEDLTIGAMIFSK